METLRQISPYPMPDGKQRQDKACEGEPQPGPHQWRAQPPHRRRALHQGVNEVRGSGHGVSLGCRNSLRNDLMARWVATLRAETDRPLASAASFKDISLSLSRLTAWR